jgi:hypothetical protein
MKKKNDRYNPTQNSDVTKALHCSNRKTLIVLNIDHDNNYDRLISVRNK